MSLSPRRIVARYLREADQTPPLGYPGGPCHVVERIEQRVRSPRLRDVLTDEVEGNHDLTNTEAAKVYTTEVEHGAGIAKRFMIGPHVQYRMDLRGITVPQIRVSLASFSKHYFDLKSRGGTPFQTLAAELHTGKPVRWTDARLGLTVVFAVEADDALQIVTAFWLGEPDPTAHPGECAAP